jgi:hypothetical protein
MLGTILLLLLLYIQGVRIVPSPVLLFSQLLAN